MAIFHGSNKVIPYLGNRAISERYRGSTLVFQLSRLWYLWNNGTGDYTGGWTNMKNATVGRSELSLGTDSTIRTTAKISTSGYEYICLWVRVSKSYDGVYDIGIWNNVPSQSIPSGGWSSGYVTHIKNTSPSGSNQYRCYILPVSAYQGNYFFVYGMRGYGSEYAREIVLENAADYVDVSTSGSRISRTWSDGGHTLTVVRNATGSEGSPSTNSFTLTAKKDCKIALSSYSESGWNNYSVSNPISRYNGAVVSSGTTYTFSMTANAQNSGSRATWIFNIMS